MTQANKRIALIFMPFGSCRMPSLGISLLKSSVVQSGFECDVHYMNLSLAEQIGFDNYILVSERLPSRWMFGEWLFSPSLFGENPEADLQYINQILFGDSEEKITPVEVLLMITMRDQIAGFIDECFDSIDWSQYAMVGFSTTFHQNCASLALARKIKLHYPYIPIAFGGANCADGMGTSLLRLFPYIDYVCPGEGDLAFPALVEAIFNDGSTSTIPGMLSRHEVTDAQAIPVRPVLNLDTLPYTDFTDYFTQLKQFNPPSEIEINIPMETARGCWWGQVHQCTFCGLNSIDLRFRSKSTHRVLNEVICIKEEYGNEYSLQITDNILDYRYFQTLLPELVERALGLKFFWEIKANLKREQIALLTEAGVMSIQPGIESFSDTILGMMRKGTTCLQNIQTLKWSKQFGIKVGWNILYGFPGEDPAEYATMAKLLPLLFHLDSPNRCSHFRIDRFSVYHQNPSSNGVKRLTPAKMYRFIYHPLCEDDLWELANIFDGEYPDDSANYTQCVVQTVKEWQARTDASLDVFPSVNSISIVDTRKLDEKKEYQFDGVAADAYILCDSAHSVRALMNSASIREGTTETEVKTVLDHFIDLGLMIHQGKQYLSLAVVRDGQPLKHS